MVQGQRKKTYFVFMGKNPKPDRDRIITGMSLLCHLGKAENSKTKSPGGSSRDVPDRPSILQPSA
jgi:hypothetical protein